MKVIALDEFRAALDRAGLCHGSPCPGVLAGADHPHLCPACKAAFRRAGVNTENTQLELDDEEPAA